ncbi:Eco57I restriction-modification methylase domain-containing protein [Acetobacterium woodii]|uniref:site-specific DNA-methyltransferase (adenine-specific) n=1 Tax=Acetobacterium woodii (strain ATCC 29683 / DSM 1030 / JCM 2381 / KCTC 1655 / WB1) TaxID=931626 RepID=H6LFU1_ACEWD|nr:N-6 DNA methylase [Acetobacterium woodii]AFA48229.1 DNA modification methyltransferase [Acetobacterium woodii DSM 1030]
MKFQEISGKLTGFIKKYNYLTEDGHANVLFLLKCLVLKYLSDNHRIDFERHKKDIKKKFTFDYIMGLWADEPIQAPFWDQLESSALVIGDDIWKWVCVLVEESPSLEGENPGLIGSLYEESLLINHKKNHGIFYTPENIARYMAANALKKYQGADALNNIRILDPACGSGSLLSAVYDHIILKYSDTSQINKGKRHQMLLQHCLIGVDRDPIACLVTRLILTLKGGNYVNPLGIFNGDILTEDLVAAESIDVVIGNPPYVGHKEIDADYMKNLKNHYAEVYQDKGDLSYCFVYRGWELLKPEGQLIHITSRYFIEAFYGKPLRAFIKKSFRIHEIVDFNGLRIIAGVGVDPAIIRLEKKEMVASNQVLQVKRFFIKNHKVETYPELIQLLEEESQRDEPSENELFESFEIEQSQLMDDSWRLYSPSTQRIIEKIEKKSPFTLDNVVQSFQGIITGNDKAFVFDRSDPILKTFEAEFLKPWIKNKDVRIYSVAKPQMTILYSNTIGTIEKYPQVLKHLEKYKQKLKNRRECKNGKLPWYKLQWGRDPEHFERRKIIFPYKATQNRFAIDEHNCYFSADVYGMILKPRLYHQMNEEFLVMLLNSQLYNYYFKSYGKKMGDNLYEYYPNTLLRLGIPDINEEDIRYFKDSYDRIIQLKKNGDHELFSQALSEIDDWFYHYFDLTQAEIKIVKNKS